MGAAGTPGHLDDPKEIIAHLHLPLDDERLLLREAFGSVEWIQLDRGTIGEEAGAVKYRTRHAQAEGALYVGVVVVYKEALSGELRPMEGIECLLTELKEKGYGLYLLSNATVRLGS